MRKTIIALQATKSRGKTQAIALAHQSLLDQGAEAIRHPLRNRYPCIDVRQAILKIDGVLVGFASSGDDAERLEKDLTPLFAAECGVIVSATHTARSASARAMERLALEHGYKVVPISKERSAVIHEGRDNHAMADEIVRQVREATRLAVQLVEA